ncbi:MAG: gamma-glutamylcyclotransferase [Moraxella sp.]|nr:gamma-glutamylcyclotransferase [Moraxella sp.]
MEHLFVYGTLAPNRANAHILADVAGTWQGASVRGHLHAEGWGATMGFPAIVLDDMADDVAGFVLTSDELHQHWQRLDDFEGAEYQRVLTAVRTADGEMLQAYVYVLAKGLQADIVD